MNVESEITESFGDEKRQPMDFIWLAACTAITALATFVRFFWLGLKPLHHDEGVNGYFLTNLFRSGEYKYDPANYHGPDLYYLAIAFTKFFGLNTLSVRSSVAIFGVLTVVLALYLRRYIGRTGALFAAFFIALSPGMTFISRYFIHEILFVFLSFGIALSVLFLLQNRKAGIGAIIWLTLLLLVCFLPSALNLANQLSNGSDTALWALRVVFFIVESALVYFVVRMLLSWHDGRPIYLLLASASAVLLFATKETAFITIGTMIIATGCVAIWRRISSGESFVKNRFFFAAAASVLVGLGLLTQIARIKELFGDIYRNFELAGNQIQLDLYYVIIGLIVLTAITWVVVLFFSKDGTETRLAEDPQMSWNELLTATRASDTSEFFLAKTAVGGVTIAIVWVFVRFVVAMMTQWKGGKGAGSAMDKIELGKIDGMVLLAAGLMIVIAAALWLKRNPPKVTTDILLMFAAATIIFLYVGALFFSSFFTFPEGLQRAFEAYAIWTKTGNTDHTQNGNMAYIRWGLIIESPILIISALGTMIALLKAKHRFAMFAGLWALGLFLAYTIIPYKTPWLALSFLLPMCVIAGYAFNELLTSRHIAEKVLGVLLAIVSAAILGYQTYDINFVRYDNDAMPYIYAHTRREFEKMIGEIKRYAEKSGKGTTARIEIVSPDYWPMPWYMNDYSEAIFQGKAVDPNGAELIVAKKGDQDADIVALYGARYRYVGEYPLRPGVELILLVRNDIADANTQDVYELFGEPLEIK